MHTLQSCLCSASFLHICAATVLEHSMEFKQLLAAGDRDVVYGVIKWVLSQGQVLEKRAFVGFYLSFPEVNASAAAPMRAYSFFCYQAHSHTNSSCTGMHSGANGLAKQALRNCARQLRILCIFCA
jgi:hypothetical protein